MRLLALLASLVGLSGAAYLTHAHIQGGFSDAGLCHTLSDTGCSVAIESGFGALLGVPVPVFAVGLYAALLLAVARGFDDGASRVWAAGAAALACGAVAGGLFLLGVMAQARSYCPVCIGMDGCNLVLAALWLRRALSLQGPALAAGPLAGLGLTATLVAGVAQIAHVTLAPAPAPQTDTPASARAERALTVEQCHAVELSALEISDFLCAYCKRLQANLSGLLASCGARVDKRFVHFPLDTACNRFVKRNLHPGACRLAEASECARQQGKFVSFAAGLFETTPRDAVAVDALARRVGLDLAEFTRCLDEGRTRDRVRTDIELAHRLGVRSTPTFYLNGRRLEGALSRERLEREISLALQKDAREARAIQSQAPASGASAQFSSEPAEACDAERFSRKQDGCALEP
ncbi:MAG: thioredoxin domain-containing protein [Proteobacteria bacterium]|nr:thioredoxin domain-containing protein [Pseudomonadota bacterium]